MYKIFIGLGTIAIAIVGYVMTRPNEAEPDAPIASVSAPEVVVETVDATVVEAEQTVEAAVEETQSIE
jgi:hypothetical protein